MSFFPLLTVKSAASEPNLSVCSPKKSFRDSETMSRELSLAGLLLIGVWVLLDVLIFRWCALFYCFESNCTMWTQEDRKKINVFIVIWMSRWEDRFLRLPYTAWARRWRHTTALAKQWAFYCSVGCLSATLKMLEKSFGVVVSRTTSDRNHWISHLKAASIGRYNLRKSDFYYQRVNVVDNTNLFHFTRQISSCF